MIQALFEDALAYHRKCDRDLIEHFQDLGNTPPEKATQLLSHIANAHRIWNYRIKGNDPDVGVWDHHSLDRIEEMDAFSYSESLGLLKEETLSRSVQYRNSKGVLFENSVRDILFHIINHGSYHRGQITLIMRDQGLEPLMSDYAILKRQEG